MGMQVRIAIRPLGAIEEYHACEELQRRVWAMPNDLEVVPLHMLLTVQKHGGSLLGAFDGKELVGFVFGFPGLCDGERPVHCSHMMGVCPSYQGRGVGYKLKLAQREFVQAQGIDLVSWTYDPLESRNAYLNLGKLGAVCRTYIRDLYGPLTDGLNAGLPSDRFQVEWWVASERVRKRLAGDAIPPVPAPCVRVNITGRTAEGLLTPGSLILDADTGAVGVEIPMNYQAIKSGDPGLALAWRMAMRQIFEAYFAAGYLATDFRSHQVDGERHSFYVLLAG